MKNQKGTTLVELLIYIGIVGVILISVSSFLLNLLTTRVKTQAISEVLVSARAIQDSLADACRHAEGINVGVSVFDSDPGVLSLDMVDAGVDPMLFSLTMDDGQFQISKAGGGNVLVTGDDVEITELIFTNLTSVDDAGIIQAQFTVRAVSNSSLNQFDYEESFQTTLRVPLD